MRSQKGLLRGSKFSRSHATKIDDADPLLKVAKKHPDVTKISLSKIDPLRSGKPHLRITNIPVGLKLQIRGRNAVQIIFIFTPYPSRVKVAIQSEWESIHG